MTKLKTTWHPIETAPKGRNVILWISSRSKWFEAWWNNSLNTWCIDDGYGSWEELHYIPTHWADTLDIEGPNEQR